MSETKELPRFPTKTPQCPKCESCSLRVEHIEATNEHWGFVAQPLYGLAWQKIPFASECIRWECKICGYGWVTKTADAEA